MVHVPDEGATDGRPRNLLIEDGAVPGVLRSLLPLALAASAAAGPADGSFDALQRLARRMTAGPADVFDARGRTAQHTLMYLLVADEPGDGRLTYDGDTVRVSNDWACDHVLSGAGAHGLRAATAALGADLVMSLVSRPTNFDAPLTVHPLGGCPMGDDGAAGVVDDRGRVYRGSGDAVHDGLLVMDGAIVPRPLATNPLLTITALAERASDLLIGERDPRSLLDLHGPTRRSVPSGPDFPSPNGCVATPARRRTPARPRRAPRKGVPTAPGSSSR